MDRNDADWLAWTREHRAAYELAPLVETRDGGAKSQTGFTLTIYAAAPMDKAPGDERQEAGRELLDELRALAQAAVPADSRDARVELEPPRTAVLRPENQFKPEVALSCRIVHASAETAVSEHDREQLVTLEKRLTALGLKRGRW
jgi:hypothetical protein